MEILQFIAWAAIFGNTEIVEILAPLTDNPNAPNKLGDTPIHVAACNGSLEIVKILAPLTDNPNAPNSSYFLEYKNSRKMQPTDPTKWGVTPIYNARLGNHPEIVKILESFKTSS